MKRFISMILCVALLFSMSFNSASAASTSKENLCELKDFLYSFNFYSSFIGTEHNISLTNAEISRLSNSVMVKTIYNGCEILSLILDKESNYVTEIHCTFSTLVRNSSNYADDFIYLLMEALMACGMEYSDISDLLFDMGIQNDFKIGDNGESVKGGIKVSYTVTSTFGVSFVIESTKK